MKKIIFVYSLLLVHSGHAQNVGIGTTTPAYPLSFSNALGNKISFYGVGGPHYGLGLQSGLLQLYTDVANTSIGFGYGSSTAFTERMRMYNSGPEGLFLNGRIVLRNGTVPLNTAYGPGIWLTRADNTANLSLLGTQNNQNVGFYGGPAGWGFIYDAVNSRVGIGNQVPNAALSFGATLGRKITLYPGTIGNAGIGVYANELRIHSDYPNADITFGHENTGGTFTEKMRIRGTGALVVNGNAGTTSQILTSSGPNASPQWTGAGALLKTYTSSTSAQLTNSDEVVLTSGTPTINLVLDKPTVVMIWCEGNSNQSCTVGVCVSAWFLSVRDNGVQIAGRSIHGTSQNGAGTSYNSVGPFVLTLDPGIHDISFSARRQVSQAATPLSVGVRTSVLAIPQ